MRKHILIALLGAALTAQAGEGAAESEEATGTKVRVVRIGTPEDGAPVDEVTRELHAKLREHGIDEAAIERVLASVREKMEEAWTRLPAEARAAAGDADGPRVRVHVAEPVIETRVERIEDFENAPAEVRRHMRLLLGDRPAIAVAPADTPVRVRSAHDDPEVREAIDGVRRARERLQRALAKRAAPESDGGSFEQRLDRLEAKLARIERLLDEALASDG